MRDFLSKLFELTRPYRGRLLLGVVTGIIAGIVEPLMIGVITFVYGAIFPSANSEPIAKSLRLLPDFARELAEQAQQALRGIESHPGAVVLLVSAIPAVMFLRGFFSYLNVYNLQWTATRAVTDLRTRLFDHLINLSTDFFHRSHSGELMSRIMNDTQTLQTLISQNTAVIVKDPVTVLGLLAYLLWNQPRLTLVALVVMPVCMVPIAIFSRKARTAARGMQSKLGELGGVMSESFTGIRVIKAYNLEPTASGQFKRAAKDFISHQMRIVRSLEIPGPLLEFAGAVGLAFVFIYLALHGGVKASSADFLKVILCIYAMYRPLKGITRLHNNLEQCRAATERVFELLATKTTVPEPVQPKPLKATGAEIQFDHVSFAYGEKGALKDIQLTIKPGQMVALVGASGSGKTTITNLLLRFYDPQTGAVRIAGVDLREVSTRDLRDQIAVVTQETILFNETIRRNIQLGRAAATEAEIITAAKNAHAHEFIQEKPEGYDLVIGEKGVTLSGGQRQRLAIARAILKNAPILILDEATSALDSESERAVQSALEALMHGRTTICIAHRLSTIQKADVIVVLDQGRIVEMGRHEELLKRDGTYRRLHDLQFQT